MLASDEKEDMLTRADLFCLPSSGAPHNWANSFGKSGSGRISSTIEITNTGKRPIARPIRRWLVFSSASISLNFTSAKTTSTAAEMTAIPPNLGTGVEWIFRSPASSIAPTKTAKRRASGVSAALSSAAAAMEIRRTNSLFGLPL